MRASWRQTESCWGRCQGDTWTWCCCLHVKVDGRWMTSSSRENMRDVENVGKDIAIIFWQLAVYTIAWSGAVALCCRIRCSVSTVCAHSPITTVNQLNRVFCSVGGLVDRRSVVSVWALPKVRKEWKFYGSSIFRAAVQILFASCLWRYFATLPKIEERVFLTNSSVGPACGRSTWNSIFVLWS